MTRLNGVECMRCPFSATCTDNIASRPNFWGYKANSINQAALRFIHCPDGYCRKSGPHSNTSVYNDCHGNKTGFMCGACAVGFTESLYSTQCSKAASCHGIWFWAVAGLYSILVALYVLCKPPIVIYLYNHVFWFRKEPTSHSQNAQQSSQEHKDYGFSNSIFYFYQVSDLLMLDSYADILGHATCVTFIIAIFNFQFEFMDAHLGCPFVGLTVVTKELFLSLQVFATMAFLVVFYGIHCFYRKIKKVPSPHFAPYMAAIVEILLLGYELLGHTSLKLLTCVRLDVDGNRKWKLYHDGNIPCWQWWQFALIAYNIIFMIPFIAVLFLGSSLLNKRQISAGEFFVACLVPLPIVIYWLVRRCLGNYTAHAPDESFEDGDRRRELLKVLQEPFREPSGESSGALYWESVLTGRRFVLLCIRAFCTNPALRLFLMTIVCVLILIQHLVVQPFKYNAPNNLASTLLFFHVVIATANLCKATLLSVGVTPFGPAKEMTDVLQWAEVALLSALPVAFCLLVLFALGSQLVRVVCMIGKRVNESRELRNPLLSATRTTTWYTNEEELE